MSVIINFKICDNCEACNALRVCPTHAFKWNEKKKTLEVDEAKCIKCKLCATSEESCQVGAIKFADNKAEYDKIMAEIAKDKRTIADLMVDRYGGMPINMPFYCTEDKLERITTSTRIVLTEVFNEESIECLIKSIPIKTIMAETDKTMTYAKLEVKTDEFIKKYNITELPSLLLFKEGKLLGKVDGYFDETQKEELFQKIGEILKRNQ